jgi:dihydropteroate synthase
MQLSLNIHNQLIDLSSPVVMAIVNITPDSFYTSWENKDEDNLLNQIQEFVDQGADIIDIGACSTRPNSTPVDTTEEWNRLAPALKSIRRHFPKVIISVDTFRAEIAKKAILAGADIINDVYGGDADDKMWEVVAKYHVPYILTCARELPKDSKGYDYTMSHIVDFFQEQLDNLHRMGVADVIIDPGFGFGKTEQQNYTILRQLEVLSILRAPILVGISRKSMLYKPLEKSPSDVLAATIAANTIALEHGANILRVHDVAAAKQAIAIHLLTHKQTESYVTRN